MYLVVYICVGIIIPPVFNLCVLELDVNYTPVLDSHSADLGGMIEQKYSHISYVSTRLESLMASNPS